MTEQSDVKKDNEKEKKCEKYSYHETVNYLLLDRSFLIALVVIVPVFVSLNTE